MDKKRVYTFGNGQAEGKADMKNLLGGKGANLAEMNLIGVPVPPGFTITTEVCTEYNEMGQEKVVALLKGEVESAIARVEELMSSKFGDIENPLLVSVRSGARASMPGMMDTILNLGLNDEVVEGLTRKTGNARFAWDSYRRFVQMYGDVVLGMKPTNKEDIDPFEAIIEEVKHAKGVKLDNELEVEDLKELVKKFKAAVKEQTGKDFPACAYEQLWGAVCAVFNSWMNERAILYRKMESIPDEWGTAVNVQAMVFGNMGETSATGVCFSRDAGTGEDLFNGEYLINAQGEDVVAGIRTPQQITKVGSQRWAELAGVSEEERAAKYPSMEEAMPEIYKELDMLQTKLENHYKDMQDMEFTVQEGKLWFLQTRNGKRTGAAMVKIAMDLLHQGMIDEKTALMRCEPNKLDELLHPVFDKTALKQAKVLTRGLPASPGAATGQIVFFADDAAEWHAAGKRIIMVRIETSPEDLAGMAVAEGILTARGGMTSHAAVVARGMGKCCVSGAGALNIDYKARTVEIDGEAFFQITHKKNDAPFIVRTFKGTVEVLGTKFNVEAYKNRNKFITSLLEGTVKVSANNQQIILKPNERATLSDGKLIRSKIEDDSYYSWTSGIINFNNITFEALMKEFEKVYGIEIVINNSAIKNNLCLGKFRRIDGLEYALKVLQVDIPFTYQRDFEKHIIYIN